jgi:hypothetical protein
MVNERMVPLLPCASIDEIRDFFTPLDFQVTYRQLRPSPYLALQREGIDLHYFAMDGFKPEDSYGSCLIVVQDTEPLFDAFAAGLRAQFGKLPLTGFPRITRPRRRKNAGNLSGFSLVDPAGNWLRVVTDMADKPEQVAPATGRLAKAMANAIVFADSKGDVAQATSLLAKALASDPVEFPVVERIEALAYLAELRVREGEPAAALVVIDQISSLRLTDAQRIQAASWLNEAEELRRSLSP